MSRRVLAVAGAVLLLVVAALTLLSGLQVLWRMPETLPGELRH